METALERMAPMASRSSRVRASLNHPIIDADGHTLELPPVLYDYMREIGGARIAERYSAVIREVSSAHPSEPSRWYSMSPQERRDARTPHPSWWVSTANTIDRATASLPRLLHQRLDDIGLDFTVLYPTHGLAPTNSRDDEFRRVGCRAVNTYYADMFRPYADRMTPAAVIPMDTPEEAIDELEHAVNILGLKAIVIAGKVMRPIPSIHRKHPELADVATWLDTFGLDSEYDYDPFWKRCVELKVAPTAHTGSMGFGPRRSVTNYMYNQMGHFAAASDALCKSLFMGGVTRRFPTLKFAFLECGVGWACGLYADIVGRWRKRSAGVIHRLDPARMDLDALGRLMADYGDDRVRAKLEDLSEYFARRQPVPPSLDDWSACGIEKAEHIRDLFVPHFYFGCEADDPINAWAFNTKVNPFGARLQAVLSSDIGHWDVEEMTEVAAEAYELVEQGLATEEDFRDFAFTNPVTLFGSMNPDFFKGTRVEAEASKVLSALGTSA